MPRRPTISAPLGKSGPCTRSMAASSSSSAVASGCSSDHCTAAGDLAQVVGRDVGGHADRDAGGPVDQQVGEPGRQHDRLLLLAVVVRLEVDGVLGDVADHLHGQRRHPALGVAHGRGLVVARRAEVALAGDQRVAHHPRLRQPHQGVVDRAVAVRVVLPHHLADDPGALVPAPVRPVAAVVHRRTGSAGAPASARPGRPAAPARRSRSSRSRGRTSGSRPADPPAPAGPPVARHIRHVSVSRRASSLEFGVRRRRVS